MQKILKIYISLLLLLCTANAVVYGTTAYTVGSSRPSQLSSFSTAHTTLGMYSGMSRGTSAVQISGAGVQVPQMALAPVAEVTNISADANLALRKIAVQRRAGMSSRSGRYVGMPAKKSNFTTYNPTRTSRCRSASLVHTYGGSNAATAGNTITGNTAKNVSALAGGYSVVTPSMIPATRKTSAGRTSYSLTNSALSRMPDNTPDNTQGNPSDAASLTPHGRLFAPPTGGGDGGEDGDPWGAYDRDLWNTFHGAWVSGEGEDGVNYYDYNTLYQLWLEYTEAYGGMMPGEGGSGYTWDELIAWLVGNTENSTGHSRLPLSDGIWTLLLLTAAYCMKKKHI